MSFFVPCPDFFDGHSEHAARLRGHSAFSGGERAFCG
jgi:hypothetical protein